MCASHANLRESGHSAPLFSISKRQKTRAPGALRPSFSSSAMLSKAKIPMPSLVAAAIALSRLTVLPKERRPGGILSPRQMSISPRLARSKLAPSAASAPTIAAAGFALTAC